jgi:hypothetical protein
VRKMPVLVAAIALVAAFVVGAAGSVASAHVMNTNPGTHCYASPNPTNCDNSDPISTGCSKDAYTAAQAPVAYQNGVSTGWIQLRYSPHCGTNWARWVKTTSDDGLATVQVCLNHVFVHCSDQYSAYVSLEWSNQIYARTTIATAFGWFVGNGAGAEGSASG